MIIYIKDGDKFNLFKADFKYGVFDSYVLGTSNLRYIDFDLIEFAIIGEVPEGYDSKLSMDFSQIDESDESICRDLVGVIFSEPIPIK